MSYWRNQAHDHDHKSSEWYAEDKSAFARANQDRKLESERRRPQGIRDVQAELQQIVGLKESLDRMLTSAKSPKEGMPQAASPSKAAHYRGLGSQGPQLATRPQANPARRPEGQLTRHRPRKTVSSPSPSPSPKEDDEEELPPL